MAGWVNVAIPGLLAVLCLVMALAPAKPNADPKKEGTRRTLLWSGFALLSVAAILAAVVQVFNK